MSCTYTGRFAVVVLVMASVSDMVNSDVSMP